MTDEAVTVIDIPLIYCIIRHNTLTLLTNRLTLIQSSAKPTTSDILNRYTWPQQENIPVMITQCGEVL